MEDIRKYKVTNSFLNNGRWFVYLNTSFNGKKQIPRANYNWLLQNPQFEDVPPGYCIHHLDLDELNDDISNLALMKSNHHRAYHVKQNKIKEDKKIELRPIIRLGKNLTIPRINRIKVHKRYERWSLRWQETDIATGKRIERQITRNKDKQFQTQKDAEESRKIFMKIHPDFNSKVNFSHIEALVCQISDEINPEEVEETYSLIKKVFPQI